MKKLLMVAFAATALLCATSCTKDDDDTVNGWPDNLTGVWTPEDGNLTALITIQAPNANGVSNFEAKLPLMNLPVTDINSKVTYDENTGKGTVPEATFELSTDLLAMMGETENPIFVIEVQGVGANKINVKIRIKGKEQHLFSKNFKRDSRDPESAADYVNRIVPITPDPVPEPEPEQGFTPPQDATGTYECSKRVNLGMVSGNAKATIALRKVMNNYYAFSITLNELDESLSNTFVFPGDHFGGIVLYKPEDGTFTYSTEFLTAEYEEYAAMIELIKDIKIYFVNQDKLHVSLKLDVSSVPEIMEQIPENYHNFASNFTLFNDNFIRQ